MMIVGFMGERQSPRALQCSFRQEIRKLQDRTFCIVKSVSKQHYTEEVRKTTVFAHFKTIKSE